MLTTAQANAAYADAFPQPRPRWRRSRRGSLWCHWAGRRLVVFRAASGWWGWLLADGPRVRYGPRWYASEDEARDALWDASIRYAEEEAR